MRHSIQAPRIARRVYRGTLLLVLAAVLLGVSACGGSGGGVGPDGAGRGLALVGFLQEDVDNVALNEVLEFVFSEPVDPATVTQAAIQIREGPGFGRAIPGTFVVSGSTVRFEPRLPGLCDLSDAALRPATPYRVTVVGNPEEFAVRNTRGQPLDQTHTLEFKTRADTALGLFEDQLPGARPQVVSTSPADRSAAVTVARGNEVRIVLSENVDPCSVSALTVSLYQVELGDPLTYADAGNGNTSGFVPVADSSPDPRSWGATNSTPVSPAQRIVSTVHLDQTMAQTMIRIVPEFGEFPDNALLVVELSSGIEDFGRGPMTPQLFSFTTENRAAQKGTFAMDFLGEVAIDEELSTADVNTARAPSLAQGYLLFSGDGDNGPVIEEPTLPETPGSTCKLPRQYNDGTKDDFDPASDVILDTGSSPNTCPNTTDGSRAVVWEFSSFRIRDGVTVRIVGSNAAIFLVQGDVSIDSGGLLLVRSDGTAGFPTSRGRNGVASSSSGSLAGGRGVAGAGDGGEAFHPTASKTYGGDGFAGFGSPDYDPTMTAGGSGQGGLGGGEGGVADVNSDTFGSGASQGGGGGGHASLGLPGIGNAGQNLYGSVHTFLAALRGDGGGTYPSGSQAHRMLTPSAGSGGGAAGDSRNNGGTYDSLGGSGGAGGGFLDITASGSIFVRGTIDAAGSAGGNGYYDASFTASGGGGGGAGGGVRLLTPFDINVSGGVITTAGGAGGVAASPANAPNHGGAGGSGRIVMEDGDSVITGLGAATLVPNEGDTGFYRGVFDAGRFKGGGLEPAAVTQVFLAGPISPKYVAPVQAYGTDEDFVAGVPVRGSRGVGKTSILIEARGYPLRPDGTVDLTAGTGWYSVGYFRDSGVEERPTWIGAASPTDVTLPSGNVGEGITQLNDHAYLKVRVTFFLPPGIGPFDAGPYLDRWNLHFTYNQ